MARVTFDGTSIQLDISPLQDESESVDIQTSETDLDLETVQLQNDYLDSIVETPQVISNETDQAISSHEQIDCDSAPLYDEFFDDSESSTNSGDEFYEIDTDSDCEELPTYPLTNIPMTIFENDLPEYEQYDQNDQLNNWQYEASDSGPSCGPFYGHSQCNVFDPAGKPEIFFNSLFDDRLFYPRQLTSMPDLNVQPMDEIDVLTPHIPTTRNIVV